MSRGQARRITLSYTAAHVNDRQVRIVDVRRSRFEAGHIPNAVWLDPESIRDANNLPTYMLPAACFAEVMGTHGDRKQHRRC
jgi:3-mercaptopyruvate sulfurtransferase SseA